MINIRKHYAFIIGACVCLFLAVFCCFVIAGHVKQQALDTAVARAEVSLNHIKQVQDFYSKNVVGRMLSSEASAVESETSLLPSPDMLVHDLNNSLSNQEKNYQLYSPFPFAGGKSLSLDMYQKIAWRSLLKKPENTHVKMENRDGNSLMRVSVANVMKDVSCVNCHNNHPDSIKTDWRLGDVRGVVEAVIDVQPIIDEDKVFFQKLMVFFLLLAGVFISVGYYIVNARMLLQESHNLPVDKEIHRELTQGILNSTLGSIITVSEGGEILSFNKAAERLFLFSEEEMVGQNISVLLPEQYSRQHQKYIDRYVESNKANILGDPRSLEGVRRTGELVPVELLVNEVVTSNGRIFVATLRDISLEKGLEDRLGKNQLEFETELADKTQRVMDEMVRSEAINMKLQKESSLVRLLHEATVAVSSVESNEEAVQVCLNLICGYTWWVMGVVYVVNAKGELKRCDSKYLALDSMEGLEEEIFEGTEQHKGEGIIGRIFKYAEPIWVNDIALEESVYGLDVLKANGIQSVAAFPIIVEGEVVGVMEFFADAVQDYNDQLIRIISSIGTQLGRAMERYVTNESLLRAKTDAEVANLAKSQFLTNMSHELRTPLHSILSFAKISAGKIGKVDDVRITEYMTLISDSGNRLLSLLNNILDLSKLESGVAEMSMRKSGFGDIMNSTVAQLGPLFDAKGLVLERNVADDLVAEIDVQSITQVLWNLLSNAIKFSWEGGTIKVLVEQLDDDGVPSVLCSVTDNGVGIPENELLSVFDKFIQSSKTKTGAGGTGLGLSICREIVHAHNGDIWVESPEGEGAKMSFIIPLEYTATNLSDAENSLPLEVDPLASDAAA